MTQNWKKLGLIFTSSGQFDWMQTHASVPIAQHICDDIFRIYFSCRDINNRSYTAYFSIDLKKPKDIIEISPVPVIRPGNLGEFDDSGAMATWLSEFNGQDFLYYIGWNLGVTVPFRNSIGVAISQDGDKFARYSSGPILDRTPNEPHFVASCCVIPGNDKWRMWYLSCTGWQASSCGLVHKYHIKYAESIDGLSWVRNGDVAIDFKSDSEYAISRPCVIKSDDRWLMWYSYRGDSYRIGYAESKDGYSWERLDSQCGINVSNTGWDSEMIEYPYVFDHRGKRYMLYNGNGYGETGIGLAVLEQYRRTT